MTGRKRALAILAIAAAASLAGASARAGHAPVTDILVNQNLFLPSEPVCPQLASALTKLTNQLEKEGYPLNVAIMASRADLGRAPQYFNRPQDYARFLGSEIGIYRPGDPRVQTNESLLTVMPAGFGLVRSGKAPNVSLVLFGLEAPEGRHANDLARATVGAIRELADAAGHPVPAPETSGCSDGGGSSALVYVVPIALVVLAGGVFFLVARRRASDGPFKRPSSPQ